jgi:predicted outer membrane repeat protein
VEAFGGAIWGLDVSVQDTSFTNNSAGTDGGAVFIPPDGLLVVAESTFEANAGSKISLCSPSIYADLVLQHSFSQHIDRLKH